MAKLGLMLGDHTHIYQISINIWWQWLRVNINMTVMTLQQMLGDRDHI